MIRLYAGVRACVCVCVDIYVSLGSAQIKCNQFCTVTLKRKSFNNIEALWQTQPKEKNEPQRAIQMLWLTLLK